MLGLPAIAMSMQLFVGPAAWITGESPNYLLGAIGIATLLLEVWIVKEALSIWDKAKGVLES